MYFLASTHVFIFYVLQASSYKMSPGFLPSNQLRVVRCAAFDVRPPIFRFPPGLPQIPARRQKVLYMLEV